MWVPSLGWEDPLEEEMATHSSILSWKIPWAEEPGGLQSMGLQGVRCDFNTLNSTRKGDRHLWDVYFLNKPTQGSFSK